MNRKLLNGLLVLTLAAGGVGTFTSCKDENFHNEVLTNQVDLEAKIKAIREMTDEQFKQNLLTWLNGQTALVLKDDGSSQFPTYKDLVQAAATMKQLYDNIMKGDIKPNSNEAKFADNLWNYLKDAGAKDLYDGIEQLEVNQELLSEYRDIVNGILQNLLDNLAKKVTSIEINQTTNPVFGSINLPLGINSTVLATYQYKGNSFTFPTGININKLAEGARTNDLDRYNTLQEAFETIQRIASDNQSIQNGAFTPAESSSMGNMGAAYITINPIDVDFANPDFTLSIVNAEGKEVFNGLKVEPHQGDLYFGVTRSSAPVYDVAVNAEDALLDIDFDLNDKAGLVDAVKNLIKNRTVSDIASLGKALYNNMKDFLPAYAFQVSWTENTDAFVTEDETDSAAPAVRADDDEDQDSEGTDGPADGTDTPEAGTPVTPNIPANPDVTTSETTKKVVSKFELATTIVSPLSYTNADILGNLPNTQIPTIDPLTEYLDRIGNKLDDIEITPVDGIDESKIKIQLAVVVKNGKVYPVDKNGKIIEDDEIALDYDTSIKATPEELAAFANAVLNAAGFEMTDAIKDQVVAQLNESIGAINDQLGTVNGKLQSLKDYLESIKGSKKLDYAQKVVNKLNSVITKVNNFLANPRKYFQVLMAYDAGDGAHHASETAAGAVTVEVPANATTDDILTLYVSSYTGDVIVPSFKKYVAITAIDGNTNDSKLVAANEAAGLNKVIEGHELSIPMSVKGLKGLVQLTYVSLDYRGNLSAQNYYFNFVEAN